MRASGLPGQSRREPGGRRPSEPPGPNRSRPSVHRSRRHLAPGSTVSLGRPSRGDARTAAPGISRTEGGAARRGQGRRQVARSWCERHSHRRGVPLARAPAIAQRPNVIALPRTDREPLAMPGTSSSRSSAGDPSTEPTSHRSRLVTTPPTGGRGTGAPVRRGSRRACSNDARASLWGRRVAQQLGPSRMPVAVIAKLERVAELERPLGRARLGDRHRAVRSHHRWSLARAARRAPLPRPSRPPPRPGARRSPPEARTARPPGARPTLARLQRGPP
jgi:hypothetical protein